MSTAVLPSVLLEVVFKCFCGGKILWWRDRGRGVGRRKRVRSPLGNLQSWVETGAEECRQSILAFSSFLSLRSSGGIQMVSTDGCWHHFNANENPQFGVWWRRKLFSAQAVTQHGYENSAALEQLWGPGLSDARQLPSAPDALRFALLFAAPLWDGFGVALSSVRDTVFILW